MAGLHKLAQALQAKFKPRPLPIRDAAPSAGTRQNRRREEFAGEFAVVTAHYGGEPRKARRKIARNTLRIRRARVAQASAKAQARPQLWIRDSGGALHEVAEVKSFKLSSEVNYAEVNHGS